MVSGVQWALTGEALLALTLGAVVVWRGLDRSVSVVLGVFFGVWSALLLLDVPFLEGGVPDWAVKLRFLLRAALVSLTFALMAVYPPGRSLRSKRWLLRLALVPVLLAGLGALADYYPAVNDGLFAFVYHLITNLFSPIGAFVPAIWFLVHAYRAPDGPRRMQFAGAGAALLIWVANDGLASALAYWGMGAAFFEMGGFMLTFAVMTLLGLTATYVVVALILFQAVRGRRGWRAGITIGGWGLLGIALSQLQTIPSSDVGRVLVHLAVDMATYLILFYFVARYQLLDVALGRPTFTTRGLAVAAGLTALIATQVMLEEAIGSAFGWLGAVLAGAAVAATLPLQQRLERFRAGQQAPGGHYEAFRRMQVYHAAVEGAMQDGQLDGGDNRTLANLRRELGVAVEDHERLLADLAARVRI